jgi:chromosome segregation ATPase
MDNHDVVVLDDFHKREGSRPEYFTPKQDRLLHSDHQNFHSPIQSFLKRNSPDPNKCLIDKRLRVLTQSRTDLAADTKSLSAKKSSDSRDVERINISKVPFLPLLSIRTSLLEELYIEIKELKVNISELEEKIKVNSHCIDTGKIKLRDLQERHSKLKKRVGLGQTVDEKREELKNRLKTIHTKWVKNSLKLKSKISELENEAKILNTRGDSLKSKIFQRSEEHQQLRRNIQKSESSTESGYHSCDHLNSSGQLKSVKYTPSYNSLSIT